MAENNLSWIMCFTKFQILKEATLYLLLYMLVSMLIFLWIVAPISVYSPWEMLKLFQCFCHSIGKSNMKWDRHRKVTYRFPIREGSAPHLQGVWSTDRLYWAVSSISVSAVGSHFSQCHTLPKMTWGCWLCNVGLKRACCFSLAQNKSGRQHLL